MSQHWEILNQLLVEFSYQAKQVCVWSGLHESRLSRFRKGKLDLEAGEFFQRLESLPQEAQDYFWSQKKLREVSIKELPIKELIAAVALDESAIAELLSAIASNLRANNSSNFSNTLREEALL